ncbi:MAG: VWA domain-containing protein, partial [Planctomycetes bacterium]|nr:VWA domain-containing protein [Planctomycetota bacterium]
DHVRALPRVEVGDLRVESVRLPRQASSGQTLAARALLARSGALRGGNVRWTIGGAETFEERVEVPEEGSLWVERPVLAREEGAIDVRVEWAQEVPDRFPENDAGTATCVVGGARRVVVSGSPAFADRLARIPGLAVDSVPPEGIDGALAGADAVVLVDLRAERLEAVAPRLLDAVERAGLGLLVAGAREAFGPGGYRRSSLRRVLPVEPGPPGEGATDYLLLLDASGSMEGEKYAAAREALSRLASEAADDDSVAVATFAESLRDIRVWKAEGRPPDPRAAGSLAGERPGGETDLSGSVAAAARSLGAGKAGRRRRLLVLTDGRVEGSPAATIEGAAEAVRKAGAEVVLFSVGSDADLALLERFASACGGRTLSVRDPAGLASAVAGELGALHLGEERHPRRPGELADRLPLETPPTRVRARSALREGAQAVYAAVEREPLLSFWRAGAGLVAAFCSTPGEEETPGWAERIDMWGPLLEVLCRPPGGDSLRYEEGRLLLDMEEDPGNEPETRVEVGGEEVRLARVGQRRFAARWNPPALAPVGALVRLGVPRPVAFGGSFTPPEFRGGGRSILPEIARATGGTDSAALPPVPRGEARVGFGSALAGAGLLLLLAAAAGRRRTQGLAGAGR